MKTRRMAVVGGAFGSLLAAAAALGQSVQVELRDSSGGLVQAAQTFASGAAINLGTIPTNVARVNVFSTGGLAAVGTISLEAGSRSTSLDVYLGQGAIPLAVDPLVSVATNWAGLDVNASTQRWLRVAAGISGNITGPVRAATITRLQVGGAINAEIDASGELGAAADIGVIRAGSIGVDGDIAVGTPGNPGQISSVRTTGNLLGDVISTSLIGEVVAESGTLGNATTRVAIAATDGIDSVVAEAINADVVANANGGAGGIREMRAVGNMTGTLRAATGGDPETPFDYVIVSEPASGETWSVDVEIDGDFYGAVYINGGEVQFPLPAAGAPDFTIGGDWICPGGKFVSANIGKMEIGGDLIVAPGESFAFQAVNEFIVNGDVSGGYILVYLAEHVEFGSFSRGIIAGDLGEFPFSIPSYVDTFRVNGDFGTPGELAYLAVGPLTKATFGGTVHEGSFIYARDGFWEQASMTIAGRNGSDMLIDGPLGGSSVFDGQIVVNAAAGGALPNQQQYWTGTLAFVDDSATLQFIEEGYTYPHYATGIDKGAVGTVPYNIHDETSFPINLTQYATSNEAVLTSTFNGSCQNTGVQLEFYGPVETTGSANQPKAEVVLLNSIGEPVLDVSRFVSVTRDAVRPRQLNIRAKNGAQVPLPSGVYRVKPVAEDRIVCAGLLPGAPVTPVADFTYEFRLLPDCIGGGTGGNQPDCVADSASCGDTSICDPIDFNNNEVFPEDQDVIDFFNVVAGGACSTGDCNDIDFNNNTVFPEDADVIQFFHVLSGGEC